MVNSGFSSDWLRALNGALPVNCALEEERVCVSSRGGWWAKGYCTLKEPEVKPKHVDWVQNTAQAFGASWLCSVRQRSLWVEEALGEVKGEDERLVVLQRMIDMSFEVWVLRWAMSAFLCLRGESFWACSRKEEEHRDSKEFDAGGERCQSQGRSGDKPWQLCNSNS